MRKSQCFITFLPSGVRGYFEPGEEITVLDLALRSKVALAHSCGGYGSCTTCRVIIQEPFEQPRTEMERERAEERAFSSTERLSCQILAIPGLEVWVPES